METVLTVAGLMLFYESTAGAVRRRNYLCSWGSVAAAGFAVAFRPTALVLWTAVAFSVVLFNEKGVWTLSRVAANLLRRVLPGGVGIFVVCKPSFSMVRVRFRTAL